MHPLLRSTSAIFAMFISMAVLGRRYDRIHLAGTIIVGVGLVLINYSKYVDAQHDPNGHVYVFGTVLALLAAIGYALSNVLNEVVSQHEHGYPIGALFGMGLFASIVAAIVGQGTAYGQADRDQILSADPASMALVGMFVACMVAFYLLVPAYIQQFSAVRFNFNVLTADLIVLVFNCFYRHAAIDATDRCRPRQADRR